MRAGERLSFLRRFFEAPRTLDLSCLLIATLTLAARRGSPQSRDRRRALPWLYIAVLGICFLFGEGLFAFGEAAGAEAVDGLDEFIDDFGGSLGGGGVQEAELEEVLGHGLEGGVGILGGEELGF